MATYLQATHRRSYNFLLAGVLWALYEGLLILVPAGSGGRKAVNLVDQLFDHVLAYLPHGNFIVGGAFLALTALFIYQDHREERPIKSRVLGWMLLESFGWALLIYLNLSLIITQLGLVPAHALTLPAAGGWDILPMQAEAGGRSLFHRLVLSLGAGFYEELFFRLLLVTLLKLLFQLLGFDLKLWGSKAAIILLSAGLFSLAHHIPGIGEPFTWYAFGFRSAFGVAMSLLLVLRGFGIIAWSHALYDVLVELAREFLG